MDLELVAEHLGVRVDYVPPVTGGWGEYDAAAHRINLHPGLGPLQRRAVLAHELGHAAHRHEASTPRNEREADEMAHWLTIPLCGFLRAARAQETVPGVADELGVLPSAVRDYARRLGVPGAQ